MNTYTRGVSHPWSGVILKNYSEVTTKELLKDIHELQAEVQELKGKLEKVEEDYTKLSDIIDELPVCIEDLGL